MADSPAEHEKATDFSMLSLNLGTLTHFASLFFMAKSVGEKEFGNAVLVILI